MTPLDVLRPLHCTVGGWRASIALVARVCCYLTVPQIVQPTVAFELFEHIISNSLVKDLDMSKRSCPEFAALIRVSRQR